MDRMNPMRQYTNKVSKYVPHTGLKEINKGRKRVGLPPLEPAAKEGQVLTLTVPDLGEIKVDR
jgi:hypothetical protein